MAQVGVVLTRQQGKKRAQSPPGPKPDCDNCARALKLCEWPPPSRARGCQPCKALLRAEWGGVRVTQEGVSEEES